MPNVNWVEEAPYKGFRGFTRVSKPFIYIIGCNIVSSQELFFGRLVDDISQGLRSAKLIPEGEYLSGFVAIGSSNYPRPMIPEELDDFSEDFRTQLQSFDTSIPKEIIERNLESNLAQARRQTTEHMKTYSFLRNHDIFPYFDVRIQHLVPFIDETPEFNNAHESLLSAFRKYPGDKLDRFVAREVVEALERLYGEMRKLFSNMPREKKDQYRKHVSMGIRLFSLGSPSVPYTLAPIPTEENFPEFKPEMGIPILRRNYKSL